MKKQFITLIALLLFFFNALAQDFPTGMKYQAVARDLSGNVISEQNISLKITLFSITDREENGKNLSYVELHQTKTNQLGLFSLTIGGGESALGKFENIPWSEKEIWMAVEIDPTGGANFLTISESKLLAVPYAIHAFSASELTNGKGNNNRDFEEGSVWEIGGNILKPNQDGTFGTLGIRDILFITNGTPRMTITATGDVEVANNLLVNGLGNIGQLEVDGDVNLNALNGETIIGGRTTIKGETNIYNDLYVGQNFKVADKTELLGYTFLKKDIEVDGSVFLNTGGVGTLTNISGPTTINNTLDVDNTVHMNKVGGTTTIEGATRVNDIMDVESEVHLNIVDGKTTIEGATRINDIMDVESTVHLNIVGGTTTIEGATDINNSLDVDNDVTLNSQSGSTNINGPTSLKNTLNVTGITTIEGATTINNELNTNGQVSIKTEVNGDGEDFDAYPLNVEGSDRGISIKVNAGTPDGDNHFVTFFDNSGEARGAIQGQTEVEVLQDPEYLYETASIIADIALAAVNLAFSFGSVEACGGVGGVVCPPDASQIAQALADQVKVIADGVAFQVFAFINVGVTYESGGADYAEWLQRINPTEQIHHGEIVGVYGGKISKNTSNANQYLVISSNPAILGNMPQAGQETLFEKVAFMGQVPVKVRGDVNIGDYIIPSGLNDGTGIAISPEKINASDFDKIVGIAWSATPTGSIISYINLAIGLNTNDVAKLVNEQVGKIEQLENDLANFETRLLALENGAPIPPMIATTENITNRPINDSNENSNLVVDEYEYVEVTATQLEDAIMDLKEVYMASGVKIEQHYGYNKLFNDKQFRTEIIENIIRELKVNKAFVDKIKTRF